MLFQRWVQMGLSSPEVSCWGCELTRLWMLCRVDLRYLVGLSREAVELTLGGCLHLPVRGLRPYRFRSDNRGCSRTNAWQLPTLPRRRLPAFLSKASTCKICKIIYKIICKICRIIFVKVCKICDWIICKICTINMQNNIQDDMQNMQNKF